jgi:hypothetical protein
MQLHTVNPRRTKSSPEWAMAIHTDFPPVFPAASHPVRGPGPASSIRPGQPGVRGLS